VHELATSMVENHQPTNGDVTMCIRCGEFAAFDADLALRALTPDEWDTIKRLPVVQAMVTLWAGLVHRNN
jgi:hypothetical protein